MGLRDLAWHWFQASAVASSTFKQGPPMHLFPNAECTCLADEKSAILTTL